MTDAAPRTRTLAELRALLAKIEGQEGQTERAAAVRAEIEARG